MVNNCREWSTETGMGSITNCVNRGGGYSNPNSNVASSRGINGYSLSNSSMSFRPILYL